MKVYINVLILVFLSVMVAGCTGDKKKIDYTIDGGSGGVSQLSGSISLEESDNIAYINDLSGSVMIDDVNVTKGAVLGENSVLVTGSGAEAEIIFADNSLVRLSENSRLQISKKGTDNTTLHLQEGTLWTRVLSPFTDISFFTLETNDLSAGVRGTSVWLVTDSGGTDIGIVDTTSTGGQSSGALIDIRDKNSYGTGSIHLLQEEVLKIRHSKPLERKKMVLKEQIKMHPFVGVNTVRDIRYMNTLMKVVASQTGTRDRIEKEMEVTMPRADEVTIFLTDPSIRSQLQNRGSRELTPTEFMRYLDLNEKIETIIDSKIPEADKKEAIEAVRKLLSTIPLSPISLTGSTGTTTPLPIIKRPPTTIVSPPRTIIRSIVSGEKAPCITSVSGEPCR